MSSTAGLEKLDGMIDLLLAILLLLLQPLLLSDSLINLQRYVW